MSLTEQRLTNITGTVQQQQQQQQQQQNANVLEQAAAGGRSAAAAAAVSNTPRKLLTNCPDTLPRLKAILGAMIGDLLGRIMLDRHTEGRWPTRLTLTLTICLHQPPAAAAVAAAAGVTGVTPFRASRSCSFPPPPSGAAAAAAAAGTAAPAAAAATATGADSSGTTPTVAAAAAAAADTSSAAFPAPGVWGERAFAVPPQLHTAAVDVATGLAQVEPGGGGGGGGVWRGEGGGEGGGDVSEAT
mgnify:CR=1 FL=1